MPCHSPNDLRIKGVLFESIFAPAYRSLGCDDERALVSRSANMVAEQDRRLRVSRKLNCVEE